MTFKNAHSSMIPAQQTIQVESTHPFKTNITRQKSYHLNLNEDYLFYSNPVSRNPSFSNLKNVDDEQGIRLIDDMDVGVTHRLGKPKEQGFPTSKRLPALYNPKVREQIQKLKTHHPWFLGIVSVCQVGLLIASLVLNYNATGNVIQLNPFNYMIGPDTGVNYLYILS